MTLSEKAAYLKGLMDGLDLNKESAEGKMIAGIVDLLGEMTTSSVQRTGFVMSSHSAKHTPPPLPVEMKSSCGRV